MRPYKIEIIWIDYSTTNQDDIYRVNIYDNTHKSIIESWETTGDKVGQTISMYMQKA